LSVDDEQIYYSDTKLNIKSSFVFLKNQESYIVLYDLFRACWKSCLWGQGTGNSFNCLDILNFPNPGGQV